MAAPARSVRNHMTVEAYLALPETMTRMDYVEGEVIVSPAPTVSHQRLVGRLYVALWMWAESRRLPTPSVLVSPMDIWFSPGRILQPDVAVWVDGLHTSQERPIRQLPDLVIEVLSDDQAYDRVAKRLIYGEAGVREMWAIDPIGAVERWTGDRLFEWEAVDESLTSPLLPGFELELGELFKVLR